jgi:DNA-binding transcriptional MerR regulator
MTTNHQNNNPDLISLNEASQILGVHKNTLRRYIQLGKLKEYVVRGKYGNEKHVSKEEIEKLFQNKPLTKELELLSLGIPSDPSSIPLTTSLTTSLTTPDYANDNPDKSGIIPMTTPNHEQINKEELYLLKLQIEILQKDKEYFQERCKDVEQKWWEQFEYNKDLLTEKKLLTEGEQQLKERVYEEKFNAEQSKKAVVDQLNKEKQDLVESYEKKIKSMNFFNALAVWIMLIISIVAVATILWWSGLVEIKNPRANQGSSINTNNIEMPHNIPN